MSAGTFQSQTARKPQTLRTSQPRYLGRETDSHVPVVRGSSRAPGLPQTGPLPEFEIFFLPILQLGKRRQQQSDAPGHLGPCSAVPRKPAITRDTQGMLQRSQTGEFSKSAPKSELGSTKKGRKRGFRYRRVCGDAAKGLRVAGEGHGSFRPFVFPLLISDTHHRALSTRSSTPESLQVEMNYSNSLKAGAGIFQAEWSIMTRFGKIQCKIAKPPGTALKRGEEPTESSTSGTKKKYIGRLARKQLPGSTSAPGPGERLVDTS